MTITEVDFTKATGTAPIQDDLDRCNCKQAGEPGHWDCGWCEECNKPYFMDVLHKAPRKLEREYGWVAK